MRSATRNKTGKDVSYVAWLHTLPCIVGHSEIHYPAKIEAAHVGVRGLSQKAPDREALPVCIFHHTQGRYSLHVMGKKFWEFHGLDKDYLIAKHQARFDAEQGKRKQ